MLKFNRNYILGIATANNGPIDLQITLPFTLELDITRNTLSSANVCQLRIYNLAPETRNKIRKDSMDFHNFKRVELKAGYGNVMATIFKGNISQAFSTREGSNFITQIECYDGGYAFVNAVVNLTFPSGTLFTTVIRSIAQTLPNVTIGAIGNYPGVLTRSSTYSGNPMYILSELTGGGCFIDKNVFSALKTNEFISGAGSIAAISSDTGLLGTPVLEQTIVHFDMIFEPGLTVGQQIILESATASPGFNGIYKVTAVKHRGMISSAVCGDLITTGEFFYNLVPTPVADFAGQSVFSTGGSVA